jgi:hypothetical protein
MKKILIAVVAAAFALTSASFAISAESTTTETAAAKSTVKEYEVCKNLAGAAKEDCVKKEQAKEQPKTELSKKTATETTEAQ